jgi:hypothetical protein
MRFIYGLLLILTTHHTSAQEYFQQKVDYEIDVTLDDKSHQLNGNISFAYTNNSPNELNFIYMHLWPNAYQSVKSALGQQITEEGNLNLYYATADDKGFIDSLNFKVNNQPLTWEFDANHKDIAKILLPTGLKSGETVVISTPFRVKIPNSNISRLGHVGQSYQVTQWYPKPAVYDKDGWHPMPYLSQGEFYSEFGSFNVRITLPENYVVGATGDLVNGEKELAWLENIHQATLKKLDTLKSKNLSFPASSNNTKTLHYYQENVHDFAWFADKRFNVLRSKVVLPYSKREVETWLMFTDNEARLWKNALPYINDAVYYYSLWMGDYPYNHATAIDGTISAGAGMEYPNITVIGTSGTAKSLETVIVHEVGHNWFYGILGSNERVNAWMDEGINSFYENRYFETKYPGISFVGGIPEGLAKSFGLDVYSHRYTQDLTYLISATYNADQPIVLHSAKYTPLNYGAIVYSKTAIMFDYLKEYFGAEKFDKIMQTYYETWKFKHPSPKDLQAVFENESGENLSWFFDDMMRSTKKLDYKIVKRKKTNEGYSVVVKSNTKLNGPVSISAIVADSIYQTVWSKPTKKDTLFFSTSTKPQSFKINADLRIPEVNVSNNYLRNGGVLKKVEPLRLQFLGGIDNPNKTNVYYAPIMGWNNYDQFMLGMAFYNRTLYERPFEYALLPMYSFGRKTLSGLGNIQYNIQPENTFQKISVGLNTKRFGTFNESNAQAGYNKLAPFIDFVFKPSTPRKRIKTTLSFNYDFIQNQFEDETIRINETINQFGTTFKVNSRQVLKPKSIEVNYVMGNVINATTQTFSRLSVTANYRHNYTKELDGIDIRFYAGKYFNTVLGDRRFRLYEGGDNGLSDFTYESMYFGRRENYTNALSQQMIMNQGAMRTLTPFYTSEWLTAFNFDFELPSTIKLPFGFYADFAAMPSYTLNVNTGVTTKSIQSHFVAGLSISVVKNVIDIYLPFFHSLDLKEIHQFNNISFLQTIRFNININKLNPYKIIERTIF